MDKNKLILGGIVASVTIAILGMWGLPKYLVYQQALKGEAELARAQQNRQIKIQEAMALKESAKMLAEAEIERAKSQQDHWRQPQG